MIFVFCFFSYPHRLIDLFRLDGEIFVIPVQEGIWGFYSSLYFLSLNHLFRLDGELLFCLQQQKSNQKNAAPNHSPLKNRGSLVTHDLFGRCGTHSRITLAQTVLAESPSQIIRSSVSSKGGLKTNRQSIEFLDIPIERAIGWCRECGVVREDCLSAFFARVPQRPHSRHHTMGSPCFLGDE